MNYSRNTAVYFESNDIKRLGGFFDNNKHATVIHFLFCDHIQKS